uniref:Uncharacterized protein n=1 Tax=Romanomermis culicivorax TaxID=13658 RepID=A0A915LBT3_ROMCU
MLISLIELPIYYRFYLMIRSADKSSCFTKRRDLTITWCVKRNLDVDAVLYKSKTDQHDFVYYILTYPVFVKKFICSIPYSSLLSLPFHNKWTIVRFAELISILKINPNVHRIMKMILSLLVVLASLVSMGMTCAAAGGPPLFPTGVVNSANLQMRIAKYHMVARAGKTASRIQNDKIRSIGRSSIQYDCAVQKLNIANHQCARLYHLMQSQGFEHLFLMPAFYFSQTGRISVHNGCNDHRFHVLPVHYENCRQASAGGKGGKAAPPAGNGPESCNAEAGIFGMAPTAGASAALFMALISLMASAITSVPNRTFQGLAKANVPSTESIGFILLPVGKFTLPVPTKGCCSIPTPNP